MARISPHLQSYPRRSTTHAHAPTIDRAPLPTLISLLLLLLPPLLLYLLSTMSVVVVIVVQPLLHLLVTLLRFVSISKTDKREIVETQLSQSQTYNTFYQWMIISS
jgi:hypothetical protein